MVDLNNKYKCGPDEINYYHPKFIEKLSSFIDVTKDDFTKYQIGHCILGNMYTIEHYTIEFRNYLKKRTKK